MQICLFRCLSEGVGFHWYVLNFKHFWILSEGGGRNFSIIFEIQKVLNYPRGGGSSLIGNFSQIFSFFRGDSLSRNHKFPHSLTHSLSNLFSNLTIVIILHQWCMPGISQPYFRHSSSISLISQAYHKHISDLSQIYLRQISDLSKAYLRDISCISFTFFRYILGKSQT